MTSRRSTAAAALSLLAACATPIEPALFEPGYQFRDASLDVAALVARNPADDLIYIYFNREMFGEDGIDVAILHPDQTGFLMSQYVNAVGGIAPGETKLVPHFDAYCLLADDMTIHCTSTLDRSGSATFEAIGPEHPAYEDRLESWHLRQAGDATLSRDGVVLDRTGI